MISPTQILNWLAIGFEQPNGSLTEHFYYDKQNAEFFSILFTDYFILDEDLNLASNVTTNYSKQQENYIVSRIKRIEEDDPTIISIPRVTLEDRKDFMQQFADTLSDQKLVGILNQRIKNHHYNNKFDFYFGNEADELTKVKWEETKNMFLLQQAETFLNLNNINLDKTSLWLADADGSVSIDLTNENNAKNFKKIKLKKSWWKLW
ncbi:hypothetical protein J7E50_19720 [Pedobacter sp. ISL-68]|uniref:hypothetical protein n=1 Tax=unclassified Pedobacter TaxID=2628915 RepID=UPI001BE5A7A8|nr:MULTISPECIES: hypothetical protein [unclassified Pedobacter]MBT2564419.1 hypothetical protein [Pedobacter sp. ISL-64]MBT2592455.1 hypothetical protein [Pedobacter sp. ISL-68]